jgi:hypothetical protein
LVEGFGLKNGQRKSYLDHIFLMKPIILDQEWPTDTILTSRREIPRYWPNNIRIWPSVLPCSQNDQGNEMLQESLLFRFSAIADNLLEWFTDQR